MANLNTRSAHEVARRTFTSPHGHTGIVVVRSDRKVLRRWTGDLSSGYTILGQVREGSTLDVNLLDRILVKRGYTPTT